MPVWNPLRRCAALGAVSLLALAGCTGAGGAADEQVSEDQAALTELSERVESGETHAYTAEYLVEGSDDSVVVAADPEAGDAAVVIGDQPERWTGGDAEALPQWLGDKLNGVLPDDGEVATWLAETSADPSAQAEFSDTTLAGQLANCVDVQGAENSTVGAYEVCVTTIGVIASVTAQVGDLTYTAKLVNYHDGVDQTWLDELSGNGDHGDE
ncbi:hypothetical protein [Glycomyces buryatensis]|uniref:Lipoprotein n=1 Tax=Glycomyces buryatensis TaxID=2570927 RepID=A0A4S8QBV4_9ACTN|nr:hypothetical protein [Glycomyces buryatensis]THV42013.1 hypothetical protein FAB82_08790 [Glycomyces buryatensis]